MQVGHRLRHRQPKARTRHIACAFATIEPLQHGDPLVGRDAGTVVDDRDPRTIRTLTHTNHHPSALTRKLDGIVNEIDQRLEHQRILGTQTDYLNEQLGLGMYAATNRPLYFAKRLPTMKRNLATLLLAGTVTLLATAAHAAPAQTASEGLTRAQVKPTFTARS